MQTVTQGNRPLLTEPVKHARQVRRVKAKEARKVLKAQGKHRKVMFPYKGIAEK